MKNYAVSTETTPISQRLNNMQNNANCSGFIEKKEWFSNSPVRPLSGHHAGKVP